MGVIWEVIMGAGEVWLFVLLVLLGGFKGRK